MQDYLKTADVWTVLDLIVAEFTSDPMSVQCFDLRLVDRAKELNRAHQAWESALLAACKEALDHLDGSPVEVHEAFAVLDAAIAKAEGR